MILQRFCFFIFHFLFAFCCCCCQHFIKTLQKDFDGSQKRQFNFSSTVTVVHQKSVIKISTDFNDSKKYISFSIGNDISLVKTEKKNKFLNKA